MIRLSNFSCSYHQKKVIDQVNLELPSGQIVAVIGRNGSGKSTLAQILTGLKTDFQGEVWLDELQLKRHTALRQLRQKIGLVLQNPDNQILFSKVYDDIAFALENMQVPVAKQREIIETALQRVDALDLIDANPHELSGGQKQRIVIALALAMQPEYLVLDEATSALDPVGKRSVWRILQELKDKGIGIIFVTNWLDELVYADSALVLDDGKIYSYTRSEMLNQPELFTQHGLEAPLSFNRGGKQQ